MTFQLFDLNQDQSVSKEEVKTVVAEVGSFLLRIARGMFQKDEFTSLKETLASEVNNFHSFWNLINWTDFCWRERWNFSWRFQTKIHVKQSNPQLLWYFWFSFLAHRSYDGSGDGNSASVRTEPGRAPQGRREGHTLTHWELRQTHHQNKLGCWRGMIYVV